MLQLAFCALFYRNTIICCPIYPNREALEFVRNLPFYSHTFNKENAQVNVLSCFDFGILLNHSCQYLPVAGVTQKSCAQVPF